MGIKTIKQLEKENKKLDGIERSWNCGYIKASEDVLKLLEKYEKENMLIDIKFLKQKIQGD